MTTGPNSSSNTSKLLPWIVLFLAALGLFYFVQKGCNPETGDAEGAVDTRSQEEAPSNSFRGKLLSIFEGDLSTGGMTAKMPHCVPFDKVHFKDNTARLKAGADDQLNELVQLLKSHPNVIINIEGHTSNVGDPEENRLLSEQRAKTIKDWLERKGIPTGQLIVSGWGDRIPFTSNDTEEGRIRNTRVEVCVVQR